MTKDQKCKIYAVANKILCFIVYFTVCVLKKVKQENA